MAIQGSKMTFWAGWVLSALTSGLLIYSSIMKFLNPPEFAEALEKIGWAGRLMMPLGVVELVSTVVYLVPRTAVLGAILLTGYMGGAIATHVRVGDPFITQAGIGIVIWLGLYLRDPRLRALLPLRTPLARGDSDKTRA